jgi:integrative and conjugative element protein (TIGR02256 family)
VIELPGEKIEYKELQIPKAKELAGYLLSDVHPAASLFGLLREPSTGMETVLFEVRVELAQNRKFPILPIETIAVSFEPADDIQPEVVSLREDFPNVPHLNQRPQEMPRSLCLYDISYDALKLRWTAVLFIECIREWLSRTAEGTLHQDDQPLEPLILGPFQMLILPATFYNDIAAESETQRRYAVHALGILNGQPTAYKLVKEGSTGNVIISHVVTIISSPPRVQGAIRRAPQNLRELISLCTECDVDLTAQLKVNVERWVQEYNLRNLSVLLVAIFPKQRTTGVEPTEWDTLAFGLGCSVVDLGERLGLWTKGPGGSLGAIIGKQEETTEQVPVSIVNPVLELDQARAAMFNGVERSNEQFVMVGVGSLGSMLLNQLARKGFGYWTILDGDTMLPHNAARHLLPGNAAGFLKATAVPSIINLYHNEDTIVKAFAANSLHPGELKGEIADAIRNATAIIDCSADVPTARSLSLEAIGPGRRVSLFLSPNGENLVILAEDRARAVMLDVLEMQYYRLLLHTPDLSSHFSGSISRIRYGRSCRDLSTILSGDAIAMFAAIASRFLPQQLSQEGGCVRVWKANHDGSVQAYSCPVFESIRIVIGDLTIVWDMETVQKLQSMRAQKIPKETGGVLLGNWDQSRHILYIVDVLSAPSDSEEELTSFIRGIEGLSESLESADHLTAGSAQYIGEWHSHPDRCSTNPSALDQDLFESMEERLSLYGQTPTMLIVGQRDLRWIVGSKREEVSWNFPN